MLTLRATTLNGAALATPIEATIGEAGGSIGRADGNDLTLPDAERHISRVHARIACRAGVFELIDQGGNPIQVNGTPLGKGRAVELADGDRIRIGGYVVDVALIGTPAAARPAAVFDDPSALAAGGKPRQPAGAPAPVPPAPAADPLGLGRGTGVDPFAPAPVASPGRASAAAPRPGGAIPDDFDPFTDPLAPARPAAPPAPLLGDDLDVALGGLGAPGQGIDELFGLPPASGADPFAGTALSSAQAAAGGPASPELDPLAAWNTPQPQPSAAPVPDHVTVIRGAFRPPRVPPDAASAAAADEAPPRGPASAPPRAAPAPTAAPVATPAAPPNDIFLSWDDVPAPPAAPAAPRTAPVVDDAELRPGGPSIGAADDGARMSPTAAEASAAVAAPLPDRPLAPAPAPTAAARAPQGDAAARTVPTTSAASADRDVEALAQAFLSGLGAAAPPSLQLTPELMERVGALLREAVQGTLDLLMARALTKGEVRADATLIVARDNNPLKFSPDAAIALAHLLTPQRGPGFLPPVAAMRNAFDDLRSHQFGFMAGLRAALAGVLGRFDPATLEKRLTSRSVLDSVLPMNRRARLWDLYEQHYREVSTEAEDDFHALFGREFVRAYEEQVAKLASERGVDGTPRS